MAQKIQHKAPAPVKKDDTPSKARLAALLESTWGQLDALQGQLDELTEKINPEPAPLPDTVNPNILFTRVQLTDERDAVHKAARALGSEVEAFRKAVDTMKRGLLHGRNRQAWQVILGKVDGVTSYHLEAIDNSIAALMKHISTLAALVTFAQADSLPDSIEEGVAHE